MRVAYLGPEGTYSEEALGLDAELARAERVPTASIARAVEAVANGTVDLALVPTDNTTTGAVQETERSLGEHQGLAVVRTVELTVHHCLLGLPAAEVGAVVRVVSHREALRQCAGYLGRTIPSAFRHECPSTAEAARSVAATGDSTLAAIAGRRAATVYGLVVLDESIEDGPANRTRFVVLKIGPEPTH